MRFNKICVLGLGYIGLPTASTFATNGIEVVGVDVNPHVVTSLQNGQLHIYEPGLKALVQDSFQSGKFSIKNQPEEADAFVIAVPTPFKDEKQADMRFVISATEAILPFLRRGNLVVLESTSPPLTTKNLVAPILEKSGLKAGVDFYLAYTPERVLPGQIIRELVENARVIGGLTPESTQAGKELYSVFVKGQIILTDATTAEMVKLMENTFRDVNIAIANEFSRLADRFEVDVWEAISIANLHPRVKILNPGPGVGGHCISVDPWFLVEAAPDLTPLIKTARQVNDFQPNFVSQLVKRALGGSVVGRKVAVLGLAYKPDVDDMRESPAVETARLLQLAGANITSFDPFYNSKMNLDDINPTNDLKSALSGADLLLLIVGHSSLKALKPADIVAQSSARVIVDAVRGWDNETWSQADFKIYYFGEWARLAHGMIKDPSSATKICLWPYLSGVGGPASFYLKMKKGLEQRGIGLTSSPLEEDCQAILVIGGTGRIIDLWRARQKGVRIVQRLNGMNWVHRQRYTGLRHFILSERNNLLLATIRRKLAHRIVYQSNFSREWWNRVYHSTPANERVVYNGVDLTTFIPHQPEQIPIDPIRLLIIEGHLGGGHEYGIDIGYRLGSGIQRQVGRRVVVSILGDVPVIEQRRWKDQTEVEMDFMGVVPRENIISVDQSSHFMYTAELNAACPNSVIEAMACGLPVVGYMTGSIPELLGTEGGICVPYGSNHWKVESPDIPALVAAAVKILNNLPNYRQGARRRAVQQFDVDLMVDLYLAALQD